MIIDNVEKNNGECYINKMYLYREVKKCIQEREVEIFNLKRMEYYIEFYR